MGVRARCRLMLGPRACGAGLVTPLRQGPEDAGSSSDGEPHSGSPFGSTHVGPWRPGRAGGWAGRRPLWRSP